MGVPGLFTALWRQFATEGIFCSINYNQSDESSQPASHSRPQLADICQGGCWTVTLPTECIDRLYVDLNGLIYGALQDSTAAASVSTTDETTWTIVFEAVVNELIRIIDFIRPKELVYIAIDGVPPAAKMIHQRSRRHRKAFEEKSYASSPPFNTDLISPGTSFMRQLSHYIAEHVRLHPAQLIISDSSEPGEGEHKIIRQIRSQAQAHTSKSVVYGPDGDLLILSTLCGRHGRHGQLYILRDAPCGRILMDMTAFRAAFGRFITDVRRDRELLRSETESGDDYTVASRIEHLHCYKDVNLTIDNILYLLVLFGNDFVPSLPPFYIDSRSFNWLTYLIHLFDEFTDRFRDCPAPIEYDRFAVTNVTPLSVLGIIELLHTDALSGFNLVPRYAQCLQDYDRFLRQRVDMTTADTVGVRYGSSPGWQTEYYDHKLRQEGGGSPSLKTRLRVCADYVRAISWVADYYFDTCRDYLYYYPWMCTPTVDDLCLFILHCRFSSTPCTAPLFRSVDPLPPLEHLCHILPRTSWPILPDRLRARLDDPNDEAAQAFSRYIYDDSKTPYVFECSDASRMHDCRPFLPPFDFEVVHRFVAESI